MVNRLLLLFELFILFLLASSLKEEGELKYLTFDFYTNLTLNNSMKPIQFFQTAFYNQIYINLKVGSTKQNIPFYLYLQQYPLVLQSSNAKKGEIKGIYDENKSDKYRKISEEKEFISGDLVKGILSEDIFEINSNPSIIKFYLSVENYKPSHLTSGGKIGLKYYRGDDEEENSGFTKNLKDLDLISTYDVSILYDSTSFDNDRGKLFIGALPHEIDKNRYKLEYYNKFTVSNLYGLWDFWFDNTFLGQEVVESSKQAYFYPEFGFIVGTRNFFEKLNNISKWHEYFNITKKCHFSNFHIDDMDANIHGDLRFLFEFTGYYCDKDVNVYDIINENLTFHLNTKPDIFSLNSKDIWIERNGYKYFLILQTLNPENSWIFGKPFFKKFHMVFNLNSFQISVYSQVNYNDAPSDNKPTNHTILYICIILGLVLIVGVLAFFLIKFYIYGPRKKRANELLDENYEYKPHENEENKIIASEDGENENVK